MGYRDVYLSWLNSGALTDEERAELESIADDEKEIENRFYGQLQFGTAGLRGIMGAGTARMNVHVIRHATQAFADVINAEGGEVASRGIAVCYDCRRNSDVFAREAARVMAANGVPVRLFAQMRPTPELSFAVRHYGLAAGLNITASHNPKEYNGYKVYWSDGAQLPPDKAALIAERMGELDMFSGPKLADFDAASDSGMIALLGRETDDAYLKRVMEQSLYRAPKEVADSFSMVYTPFHGTGREMVPYVLRQIGVKNLICVDEQMVPDGDFSTVRSPNPEDPAGFELAIKYANEHGADFILGTDPDTDRVGIMVRDTDGAFVPVSGNKTGVLLLDYIIGAMKRSGRLPEQPVALKTIVTTPMAAAAAESSGVRSIDTFTGFKFMAEKKNELEDRGEGHVIFAYEESYGYMIGDHVRDKDAVTASLLLTEMAMWYHGRGMTLLDAIEELSGKYGYHDDRTASLYMYGLDGMNRMKELMDTLRSSPPAEICGSAVSAVRDYSTGTERDTETGEERPMELSGSNVLSFILSDGSVIHVRPSGTEPKIKAYVLVRGKTAAECTEKLETYYSWAKALGD